MSACMNEYRITQESLQAFVAALVADGLTVLAEAADGSGYARLAADDRVAIDPRRAPSRLSMKEHFFPKSEVLFEYRREDGGFVLVDRLPEVRPTVILGARPCDAASIGILSKVFNWDYRDEFFNRRVDATIVIGMLCAYRDEHCFCTSVGGAPDSIAGSDLFLVPLNDGALGMRVVSDDGERFVTAYAHLFEWGAPGDPLQVDEALTLPSVRFDAEKVRGWIEGHFDDPYWSAASETCLGCARCAFACPVCHCFDIVDEDRTYGSGERMRNWDACQFGMFTKHASGHNPRAARAQRYRQRISHKFAYYPSRFGEVLCTGCGRCTRGCPVGIDIGAIAVEIGGMAS